MIGPQVLGHVAVLAGRRHDGQPVHEVLPARARPDGLWQLLGSPALAEGCAEGDVLSVEQSGQFQVRERGGNIAIVSYAVQGQTQTRHAQALRTLMVPLGGKVEHPDDGRFLVATVPVTAGFPAIQAALQEWAADSGCEWFYGNVYGEDDQPLNWW